MKIKSSSTVSNCTFIVFAAFRRNHFYVTNMTNVTHLIQTILNLVLNGQIHHCTWTVCLFNFLLFLLSPDRPDSSLTSSFWIANTTLLMLSSGPDFTNVVIIHHHQTYASVSAINLRTLVHNIGLRRDHRTLESYVFVQHFNA